MKNIFRVFFVLMSLAWLGAGLFCIISPDKAFFWTQWLVYALKIEWWGLISLLLGLLFIFGSWVSGWQNFLSVIGLMQILKGLFCLITPNKNFFTMLTMWFTASRPHYRLMGVAMIILSAFVIKALTVRHKFVK